ncbi:23S rRNA (guanosine(2251)-2'-O)-methyltransferase RlmB [Acuticoccus sp. I52.16.1]|uniref:23S rRNA (guanosine(2251)-2'-O)-methyltransferase RlmB n=1 Tax=Acuticoccus sp. I52.16.1 TaxID=2928472 RepID=UPI001FD3352C|nr:23S rRNA (guanosine(2251)-2'-O)-methyltransferase RlmB [Acuticoccus sp. I52.16.1]UOM32842.1 23S rRNA (guanosine(2251)-2'-O)-methyltransferase RlmB [Acuticoccus sp. I52.16.1]
MDESEPYWLFGLHAVRAALANPRRAVHAMMATTNAMRRLEPLPRRIDAETVDVRRLNKLLGDAVHQGVALRVSPLDGVDIATLGEGRLVLCLDQITDPHNVGAILRSAAAFQADGVVVTRRHSASETGVLAKSASGALDMVPIAVETNMSRSVDALKAAGFYTVALDSEAEMSMSDLPAAERYAFVLGAEGKGVRPGVRANCDTVAAIEVPGALASLNVSNAAAITLYAAHTQLRRRVA